jgi:hypothetical protein
MFSILTEIGLYKLTDCPTERALLIKFLDFNPEIVFRRALVLANSRDDVTIDNLLSHPVGPIPVSMFHEDGTRESTVNKVSGLFFTFVDSRQ